jgi:hypothetical protein
VLEPGYGYHAVINMIYYLWDSLGFEIEFTKHKRVSGQGKMVFVTLGDFAEELLGTGGGDGKTFRPRRARRECVPGIEPRTFFIPLLKTTSPPLELSMSIDPRGQSIYNQTSCLVFPCPVLFSV